MHSTHMAPWISVSKSASDPEIKKAYKRLSKKYHPDKSGGNKDKFVDVARGKVALSSFNIHRLISCMFYDEKHMRSYPTRRSGLLCRSQMRFLIAILETWNIRPTWGGAS